MSDTSDLIDDQARRWTGAADAATAAASALVVADLATQPPGEQNKAALGPVHVQTLTGPWHQAMHARAELSELTTAGLDVLALVTTLIEDGWDEDLETLTATVHGLLAVQPS